MNLVSVIMPSCNSAHYIQAAVHSVLQQTHTRLELIIVDDGSTDDTLAVLTGLAERDSRIRILERFVCSGGPATPRNEALVIARGDYLAFIDSDDIWHPRKLELQLAAMDQYGLNFVSTQHVPFRTRPPTANKLDLVGEAITKQSHAALIRKNWVVTSSAVMSRELLGERRFDPAQDYIGIEDYLLWLQLHQQPEIRSAILPEPLVFYRLRRDSLSNSKLEMAKKIYHLLSHYRLGGESLGWRKHYYFATYVALALAARVRR